MKYSEAIKKQELTSKQSSIVASNSYPKYLRAGAGTGKTEVLVRKIVSILENNEGLTLSNFAIITFTNKASDEMKQRISRLLYERAVDKKDINSSQLSQLESVNMADISTIHAFCEKLIRRYGLQLNIAPNFTIKSFRREASDIVSRIVDNAFGSDILNGISAHSMEKALMLLLNNNANRGITITDEMLEKLVVPVENNGFWNDFKKLFLEMYCAVEKQIECRKRKLNVLTPNDLIKYAARLLEIPYVMKRVSSQYKYIFIDEFQDTNRDQFALVENFVDNGGKVFLVGDDKQSIYAFRGADVRNSENMYSMIQSVSDSKKTEYLDENFRSTPELIKTINDIFSKKFTYNGQELKFPKEPLQVPKGTHKSNIEPLKITFEKTTTQIIQSIVDNQVINGRPAQYGDIAVLCRKNFDLDRIARELKDNGIPTYVVGGKGFYRAKEIIDTYKLLNAAVNTEDSYQNEIKFTDYSNSAEDVKQLVYELAQVLRSHTIEDTLIYLYEKSRIFEYYRSVSNYQAVSNLLKLKDIASGLYDRDNTHPLQFVDYLSVMISTNQDEDEAEVPEIDRRAGVVTLYSIHKAKGLAFPIVVIPNCDSKLNRPITKPKIIFDSSEHPAIGFDSQIFSDELHEDLEYLRMYDNSVAEQLEEEIRVFYVACTRAKYQIVLSCDNKQDKVQQTIYYKDYASVIRWLYEMDNGSFVKKCNLKEKE